MVCCIADSEIGEKVVNFNAFQLQHALLMIVAYANSVNVQLRLETYSVGSCYSNAMQY